MGIDIPAFLRFLAEHRVTEALAKIREQNPLSGTCGRLCTAPCETSCVSNEQDAPLGIRALERYATDFGKPKFAMRKPQVRAGKKIAVIGSGPAGLTAAGILAQKGYRVTIFEAFEEPGGMLRSSVPSFRLPLKILNEEIKEIQLLGVEIKTNCYAGKTITFSDLTTQGFEAILLATGAGVPQLLDLPGANFGGVYYAEEFLMRVNLSQARESGKTRDNDFRLGAKVVVLGAGYMALDCARAAVRLGKQVTWVSTQSPEDKKVIREESVYAEEEGIQIESLARPLAILNNERYFVRAIKCVRLDYADVNTRGQWELIPVPDSEFTLEADSLIIAMGQEPNSLIRRDVQQLKVNDDGTIWVNPDDSMTSMHGVFACGNVVTKSTPMIEAMASGKAAAENIDWYFKK